MKHSAARWMTLSLGGAILFLLLSAAAYPAGLEALPLDRTLRGAKCVDSASTPAPTPSPEVTYQVDIGELISRIMTLEQRVNDSQALLETQKSIFEATVARMESNFTFLIAIIGLGGLAAAVVGVRLVRELIQRAVESRLQAMTEESLGTAVEKEIARLRSEFEPQFTELYEEYRRIVDRAGK